MRRTAGILAALTLVVWSAPSMSANAEDGDTAAERAAKEIADARDQANAAADALFAAESQIDALQLEEDEIRRQIADLEGQIADLEEAVESVAIDRFARAGADAIPLLTGFEHAAELAQVDVLIDIVNNTAADDFDDFETLSSELALKQQELLDKQAQTEAATVEFELRRQAAIEQVEHLKEVEADRLKDVAIRRALEAEEAERRRREDAQRESDAAAAARAAIAAVGAPRPSGNGAAAGTGSQAPGSGPTDENGSPAEDGSGLGAGDVGDSGATSGPTGGAGGGQTGNDGIGGRSGVLDLLADYGFEGWLCPVQGSVFFGDTFGAPRSGGRLHQGVDMIGARSLPIVAVVEGFVQQKTNALGGNTVWLTGKDGIKYYYAHLDAWEASGEVPAGAVIGYLGDTGNAKFSVPHLHFEIHPGGTAAVNPYPTVRAHC